MNFVATTEEDSNADVDDPSNDSSFEEASHPFRPLLDYRALPHKPALVTKVVM